MFIHLVTRRFNLKFCRFNLLLEKKKSAYVYLERKSGTAVSSKVSYVSESTGKLLKEWNFYFDLGGKDVIFSKEEVSSMKSGGNPGNTV